MISSPTQRISVCSISFITYATTTPPWLSNLVLKAQYEPQLGSQTQIHSAFFAAGLSNVIYSLLTLIQAYLVKPSPHGFVWQVVYLLS